MLLVILHNIIAPVFALVGLGFLLDRCLRLDMKTLGHLNLYAFALALVFVVIVDADMTFAVMGSIGSFCIVHLLILYAVGRLLFSLHPACRQKETVLSLCNIFYNAGNYGIPLILLAFGESHLEVIIVTTTFPWMTCCRAGVLRMRSQSMVFTTARRDCRSPTAGSMGSHIGPCSQRVCRTCWLPA